MAVCHDLDVDRLTVPRTLRAGDTVAVVSPSAPAVAWWPQRIPRATAYLESLGLTVRLMPNAAASSGWVSASAEARASDINEAFRDPAIAAVIAGIGGNHSNQLVPHLDFDLIGANPKIFQGYSDITVLHWAFQKHARLRTFYGPAFMVGLAELPAPLAYTDRYLRAAWFGDRPYDIEPADGWTEEFVDAFTPDDLTQTRSLTPSEGWVTIRPGVGEGPLMGGCLETICWHLKGSAAWPADFNGTVVFLETSEEAPSPSHVDAYLTDLEQLGVFDQAAGLLVGRPRGYSADDTARLWQVVEARTAAAGLPVLANIDCGHTDPMLTLPLGAQARFDAGARTLSVLEPPTRP